MIVLIMMIMMMRKEVSLYLTLCRVTNWTAMHQITALEVTGIWLGNVSVFGTVMFPHSQLLRKVLFLYNP
jgi:hypothetical protein